jgi:hypothetical protein
MNIRKAAMQIRKLLSAPKPEPEYDPATVKIVYAHWGEPDKMSGGMVVSLTDFQYLADQYNDMKAKLTELDEIVQNAVSVIDNALMEKKSCSIL